MPDIFIQITYGDTLLTPAGRLTVIQFSILFCGEGGGCHTWPDGLEVTARWVLFPSFSRTTMMVSDGDPDMVGGRMEESCPSFKSARW